METPILEVRDATAWLAWLAQNHRESPGVWLRLAKKASKLTTVTYQEALDGALRYGWIDGQKKVHDSDSWIQKFTARRARSIWSVVNRDKALALIEAGLMEAEGLAEVERARKDGRWDAAYASASKAEVPPELQIALDNNPRAADFFKTISSQNRYAILFRIATAKKAETKAKRIGEFVAMLERHQVLHPKTGSK